MTALRLLHIDDEPDIRDIVAMSLGSDAEFVVRSCASGMEGLAAAARDAPDLVLLDVMMPVMDGPMTLVQLRASARTAAIPVVFMTAQVGSGEIEQLKSLGVAGVIAKPFDPVTLAASVRRYVARDPLAAARAIFLQRVSADADALFQSWSALAKERNLQSALVRIRDIAHGLAGAGIVFGFPEISATAARLEEAAIVELSGPNAPQTLERVLEKLLTRMMAAIMAPWGRLGSANTAAPYGDENS
jgi:CheY-like chemotaxis protein